LIHDHSDPKELTSTDGGSGTGLEQIAEKAGEIDPEASDIKSEPITQPN
jgi:hypothetical protein